jgi:hypothetical protein
MSLAVASAMLRACFMTPAGAALLAACVGCATHSANRDVDAGPNGLGTASVTGGSLQPVNAWAFYDPINTEWGWEASSDPAVLQVMMTSNASLTCSTVNTVSEGAVGAYEFAAFPAASTPVHGSYQFEPPATVPTAPYGTGELFICGGGMINSCLAELSQSGTITIDSVADIVTGTFSMTLGGDGLGPTEGLVTGSFSAPICPVGD